MLFKHTLKGHLVRKNQTGYIYEVTRNRGFIAVNEMESSLFPISKPLSYGKQYYTQFFDS
ncbi:hypothetical protein SDC9_74944 [bioreactor metagenome]|uniref:Uncharacterized protein n=1 Tax=bioreactor metagenome TaxID=1076179 RepID=A0A644YIG0_9ZZZZ